MRIARYECAYANNCENTYIMADFLKPKEIQKSRQEEIGENEEIERNENIAPFPIESAPEIKEQIILNPEENPENAGKIASLEDEIQDDPHTKSERLQDIEKEMSKDLEDIYKGLDSSEQMKVKEKGEYTAQEIEKLMEHAADEEDISRKTLKIVRDWMHEILGVNKFFLEQESKRKTDRMLALIRNL